MAGDMRPTSAQRYVSRPYASRADDYAPDALDSSKGPPQHARVQGNRRDESTQEVQAKPVLSPPTNDATKKDILPRIRREEIILFSQMEYYAYLICLVGLSDVIFAGIAVGVSINDVDSCFLAESTTSCVLGFLILIQGFMVCIALNCYVLRHDDDDDFSAVPPGLQAPAVSTEITTARVLRSPITPHLCAASSILDPEERSIIGRCLDERSLSPSDTGSKPRSVSRQSLLVPPPDLTDKSPPATIPDEPPEPGTQSRLHIQPPNILTRKPHRTASRNEGNEANVNTTPLEEVAQGDKPPDRVAKRKMARKLSSVLYVFIIGSLFLMIIVAIVSLVNFLLRKWEAENQKSTCGDRYFPQVVESGPDERINAFKFTEITDIATLVFADLVVFWALCTFCRIRRLKDDEAQLEPLAPTNDALKRLTASFHKSPAESASSRSNVDAGGHLVPRDDETLPFPSLASRGYSVDAASQNNRWPLDSIQSGALLDWASSGIYQEDFDMIIDDPRHSRSDASCDNESSTSDPVVGHIYDLPARLGNTGNSPR
eukprot:GEMP01040081.1.p1 GENE.GEMP01040081.1~~GEMP01040081.1.p1  ORF type:complete len:544 (+),score=104.86 GEMP01040081.1:196-1827(+)